MSPQDPGRAGLRPPKRLPPLRFASAFLRDPEARGRAEQTVWASAPQLGSLRFRVGFLGHSSGGGVCPRRGKFLGLRTTQRWCLSAGRAVLSLRDVGLAATLLPIWTAAPHGPVQATGVCVHMCVRPQSAIASPLNLVGSKLGLLAVTLAAWLSQCVFIFSFKPFWRFLSSQKGLNQMSHGTVLGGPHQAGSGSQAKLTSPGFTRDGGEEGSG